MNKRYLPFYKRILFRLMLPVIVTGVIVSTLLVTYLSAPLETYLSQQFDANLYHSSMMGLRKCEESFNYLLDLRLERNAEMNASMQNEALEEIEAISSQFPHIHLMVLTSGGQVVTSSLAGMPTELKSALPADSDDSSFEFMLGRKKVRGHTQFFPFWDWHVVSFVYEQDYKTPLKMGYKITYSSAAGVFLAVTGVLLVVFHQLINKPLGSLMTATEGVVGGRLVRIEKAPDNEIGQLTDTFNVMIDSLQAEKEEVRFLIGKLRASEAMFRSQFEYGNIGIVIINIEDGSKRVNDRLRDMLGYSREELQVMDWTTRTHPDDVEKEEFLYHQMLAGEIDNYELDKRAFHKTGDIVYTRVSVSCDRKSDGSVRFAIISLLDISDRVKAQQAQDESHRMLRLVMDTIPVRVFWKDYECRYLGGNKPFIADAGVKSSDELVGKTDFDLAFADQAELFRRGDREVMDSRVPRLFVEEPQTRKDGTINVVQTSKVPMLDEDRNVIGVLGTYHDITDQKIAERKIRQMLSQLRSIWDTLPVIAWSFDKDGIFTMAEGRGLDSLGLSSGQVVGKAAFEMFKDYPTVTHSFTRGVKGEFNETEMVVRDMTFHAFVTPIFDDVNQVAGVNGLALNISEKKQAEKELNRLRKYLSNIIDSMPSVLIGVNNEGGVTQWNSEAQRMTGIPAEDATGQPLVSIFPRLEKEMENISKAINKRQVVADPRQSWREDGEIRYEDVTIYPLVSNGIEGAVIRVDDVTDRVRIEEMMVQSEKMLSVGGLAAGMAHEINNPLAGMMQTANVMLSRLKDLEMGANIRAAEEIGVPLEQIRAFMEKRGILRMAEAINDSGKRVADIVDNMLSFARKADAIVSSHDPVQLVDQVIELASTDYDLKKQYDFKTIKIIKEYEDNLPMVPCEAAKIQQVLLNILRNGAQAMQADGTCDKKEPQFILRIVVEKGSDMLRIEIEDNGPGIDRATQQRIFEPFFTTKSPGEGTGLGLSVSYFIITENHKGTMDVMSAPGEGAVFAIRLPVEGDGVKNE